MRLSEIKEVLKTVETVNFQLPDGSFVPEHFHVTEIGEITKNFIDCGGTVRKETVVNFQLWDANDYDHRLKPQKLSHIIELSEKILNIDDNEIEVEYQSETIGKYDLDFNGTNFVMVAKKTACLAKDNCGIPGEKRKVSLKELQTQTACCTPNSACC
ncbi:hypothetical protein FEDK69T_02630 [Flavobacterium enshiense DK69]|uniref:Uncharacterized protein n=1 Tax=Flavobacterium enshiense DK69 TaxID=1107311 RepID=V6SDS5_9FLAO|nr:DUF6428 family protein [Flavobacterium enshiense]ESU24711.1 hypothetical protein FEDK69T_02630 [Flavobacterium enshiense DK69]KGO96830.1 hypothetical protein Q767_03755 [Flavobacterium enshiense DK69]